MAKKHDTPPAGRVRKPGHTITIGYKPNGAPAHDLTAAQKALVEEYLAATKDAEEAAGFIRMFGTSTAAWRRAIQRGEEATAALREAGISEEQARRGR